MINTISKIGFATALIVYLSFCGCLYIIAYWSSFDFDITGLVDIWEVPKVFVYPNAIVLSGLVTVIISHLIMPLVVKIWEHFVPRSEASLKHEESLKSGIEAAQYNFIVINGTAAIIFFILSLVLIVTGQAFLYLILGLIIILLVTMNLFLSNTYDAYLTDRSSKVWFLIMFVVVPVFVFYTAKEEAYSIKTGSNFLEVTSLTFKSDGHIADISTQKKVLSINSKYVILTDSTNTKFSVIDLGDVRSANYIRRKSKNK
ncbi:hypothetical protein [Flavitalea sp.]|nr:hypothetical protein [Flavitalea sp.]